MPRIWRGDKWYWKDGTMAQEFRKVSVRWYTFIHPHFLADHLWLYFAPLLLCAFALKAPFSISSQYGSQDGFGTGLKCKITR
jgi:hypothetical protein